MKLIYFTFILFTFLLIAGCSIQPGEGPLSADSAPTTQTATRNPVLVELFTSEGCSSCPPADRNLAFLQKEQPVANADIVTLAFHVDYWDRLGWKDRFSSALFTKRQDVYASKMGSEIYTPQMIVDGQTEFVGSDSAKASDAIGKAASSGKVPVDLASTGEGVRITIRNLPQHEEAVVFLAIVEDNISSRIGGGENSGKTIEHVAVVRELMPVGNITPDKSDFEMAVDSGQPADSNIQNLRFVAFIQEKVSHRILGIGKGKFTPASPQQ
jgi:hypothetical protein